MRKRIVLALVAILCVFSIGFVSPKLVKASANQDGDIKVTGEVEDQESYQSYMEQLVSAWNEEDFEGVLEESADQLSEEDRKDYEAWAKLQKSSGEYQSILEENFSEADGIISATMIVSYENKKLQFIFTFNDDQIDVDVEEYVEVQVSLGERMKDAGINTVLSIAIVFSVLIFIAFIISLFKYIPKLFGLDKKEETPVVATAPAAPVAEVEDVTDDTELVAVITAAIMASMGSEAPEDGLVISSIKRRTGSKWKRS